MKLLLLILFMIILLFPVAARAVSADDLLPIDAVLVLDVSRSMRTADPERVSRDAMNLFIEMLSEERDRVGVVAYAGRVERSVGLLEINSPDDREYLRRFINGLEYASWTDHGVGLVEGVRILTERETESDDRQGIIIFLTDGNMNVNPWGERTNYDAREDVYAAVAAASAERIPIHAIGLNFDGNLDMRYVETVARETGGLAFETTDAADIYAIIRAFFNEMIAPPEAEIEEEPEPDEIIFYEAEPEPEPEPESPPPPQEEPPEEPAQNRALGAAITAGSVIFIGGAAFFLAKKPKRVFTGRLQIETARKSDAQNLIEYGSRVSLGPLLGSESRELHAVIFTPSPTAPSHLPQLHIKCRNPHVKFTKDFLPQDISRGIALTIGTEAAIETETEEIRIKYLA